MVSACQEMILSEKQLKSWWNNMGLGNPQEAKKNWAKELNLLLC